MNLQLKYNSCILSNPMYKLYAPPLNMEKELTTCWNLQPHIDFLRTNIQVTIMPSYYNSHAILITSFFYSFFFQPLRT